MVNKGYHFGEYFLDEQQLKLFKVKQPIMLHEKSIKLLLLLANSSPEPLSKKTLHEALWPDTVVSDWSLSRLISDTRIALGDDGEHQNIIKTARGAGFYMPDVTVINVVNRSRRIKSFGFVFAGICTALLVSGLVIGWYSDYQEKQLHEAMSRIAEFQDNTYSAFVAQAKRRNQLVDMLEQRLSFKRTRQYEMFFQHYYPNMTSDEKFVCQQIRAFSSSGLLKNNQAILDELESNHHIYDEIPLAKNLAQHLRIWIDKHNNVFSTREDMCLIYVGVEDGMPYPSGVDQQVKAWLKAKSTD
ncbi:winged helix-turn-helix domain-containing protein [Thalassotalea algicola]|nr:winged helix-turn-helix domain-containing protein [Thalassotalea algicola]